MSVSSSSERRGVDLLAAAQRHTVRAAEAAGRAEDAAGRADVRARDADRISRWTVGVAIAVAAVIVSAVIALAYRFAAVEAALERLISIH